MELLAPVSASDDDVWLGLSIDNFDVITEYPHRTA